MSGAIGATPLLLGAMRGELRREAQRVLSWRRADGTKCSETIASSHPAALVKRVQEESGVQSLAEDQWRDVFTECIRRVPNREWAYHKKESRVDISHETTPSLRLFDEVLNNPSKMVNTRFVSAEPSGQFLTALKRDIFIYACLAGLPMYALRLKKQHSLDLTMYQTAVLLKSLVMRAIAIWDTGEDRGLAESHVLNAYTDFLDRFRRGNINCIHRTGFSAILITHSMLKFAALIRSEEDAFCSFRAYRQARLFECNPRAQTAQDLREEVLFESWFAPPIEEREAGADAPTPAQAALIRWGEGSGGPQRFGPRSPSAPPRIWGLLIASCASGEGALHVLREAVDQGSVGVETFYGCFTTCRQCRDLVSARAAAVIASTARCTMTEAWLCYLEFIKESYEGADVIPPLIHTLQCMCQADIASGTFQIISLVASMSHGSSKVVEVLRPLVSKATLQRDPRVRSLLDSMLGLPESSRGVDMGENPRASASSPAVRDAERNRERADSLSAISDSVSRPARGEPWAAAVAALVKDMKKSVTVFRYAFGGAYRAHEARVIGQHPYQVLISEIESLGGTDDAVEMFWEKAGDSGVAVILQVCRLRLVYSMSITALGGFRDVFLTEVNQTQALFREAGAQGAAAKWAWRAMRMFEDEADDLSETFAVFNNGVRTGYTRCTK